MFRRQKHQYEITFTDGKVAFVEGYNISVWSDDNDPSKGDIFIEGRKRQNDAAYFRKETVAKIVKVR